MGRAKTAGGKSLGQWCCWTGEQCFAEWHVCLTILLKSLTLYCPCGMGSTVSFGQSGHCSEFWAVSSLCCLVSVLRLLWTAAALVILIQGVQAGEHSELLLLIQGCSLRKRLLSNLESKAVLKFSYDF